MRRFGNLAVIASTIGGMLLLGATHAAAATSKSMFLNSSVKSVKSTTGKSLTLTVSAFKNTTSGDTSKPTVTVALSNASTPFAVGETHAWTFHVTRSSFTYSSPSGKLTSASSSGSQLGSFGSMSLKFAKSSSSTHKCSVSGSTTTVKGTLKGSLHFSTKTKAWGGVGGSSISFATPNLLVLDSGCNSGQGPTTTCFSGLSWSGPDAGNAFASGMTTTVSGSTKTSRITFSRGVTISKPSGASRSDYMSEPAQGLFVDSTGHLVIKTKSGTHVTGNAKISKGTVFKNSSPCKTATGANKTESYANHNGSWSSPSSARLTFHFAITPDSVLPGTGTASWGKFSYA